MAFNVIWVKLSKIRENFLIWTIPLFKKLSKLGHCVKIFLWNKGPFYIPLFVEFLNIGSNMQKFPYLCYRVWTNHCIRIKRKNEKNENYFNFWFKILVYNAMLERMRQLSKRFRLFFPTSCDLTPDYEYLQSSENLSKIWVLLKNEFPCPV